MLGCCKRDLAGSYPFDGNWHSVAEFSEAYLAKTQLEVYSDGSCKTLLQQNAVGIIECESPDIK